MRKIPAAVLAGGAVLAAQLTGRRYSLQPNSRSSPHSRVVCRLAQAFLHAARSGVRHRLDCVGRIAGVFRLQAVSMSAQSDVFPADFDRGI